jgi:predicted DCC family thiol-disulfide oxidoreductase YuxK
MNEWRFKLLYDGECPFCRREVQWLQRWNRQGYLAFEDVASDAFDPARYDTTREELLEVIHDVFPDGRIVRKVEAFRQGFGGVEACARVEALALYTSFSDLFHVF